MALQVVEFLLHLRLGRSLQPPLELFQFGDHFAALIGLEFGQERFDPRVRGRVVVGMQRARHRPEVLADVVVVHALAGTGKAVAGQVPDPHRAIFPDEQLAGHRARHHTLPDVDFPAAFGSLRTDRTPIPTGVNGKSKATAGEESTLRSAGESAA